MYYLTDLFSTLLGNWPVWVVTILLVVAAVIDGWKLKVPNWLTFPMIIAGWLFSMIFYRWLEYGSWWEGLGWSLCGTAVGLALLLPAYAIGGMGAGDVKLLAGVGAWVHGMHTFHAFCLSVLIGGVIAVIMVLMSRQWRKHLNLMWMIIGEVLTIRKPTELATIAADRKSTMMLLPYGIPIALGTIAYFFWMGMLL